MSNEHILNLSISAQQQLALMLQHEIKSSNQGLRISIDGKGCDGFTYAIGFTEINDSGEHPDIIISQKIRSFDKVEYELKIIFDPFASFYLKNVSIDFQFNPETEEEGFVITNHEQKKFHGKFWRKKPELTPADL